MVTNFHRFPGSAEQPIQNKYQLIHISGNGYIDRNLINYSLFLAFGILRDHSGFFIPTKTANDLQLRRITIPSITFFCLIFILQKEPVFPFLLLSAKQGNYWYHFYNVFGMTWSLTLDLQHSRPALYH